MLSICIPNYNRREKLQRLLFQVINQIELYNLYNEVEVCVSDNASEEDIVGLLKEVKSRHSKVRIHFSRADKNYGMDANFVRAVNMAETEYCWIIGNDDQLIENALKDVVDFIRGKRFDLLFVGICAGKESTIYYPFGKSDNTVEEFTTGETGEVYFERIVSDLSIGGYIANVIFRKDNWCKYSPQFVDKYGTTIIQVYIHLMTILKNAKVLVLNRCIVKSGDSYALPEDREAVANYLIQLYEAITEIISSEYKMTVAEKVVDWHSVNIVSRKYPNEKTMIRYRELPLQRNRYLNKYYLKDDDIIAKLKDSKIVIFGASSYGKRVLTRIQDKGLDVDCYIDNDSKKWHKIVCSKKVYSLDYVMDNYSMSNLAIIIGSSYCIEIIDQIINNYEFNNIYVM